MIRRPPRSTPLSLHDALPILPSTGRRSPSGSSTVWWRSPRYRHPRRAGLLHQTDRKKHTSELQSPDHLVCRLLLEKKKNTSADRAKSTTQSIHITRLTPSVRD